MREYPRAVYKNKISIHVNDEQEEYDAGLEGYESHWNPEINEKRKGTDEEILRVNPELERKRLEEEKRKQYNADLIEVAKQAILEDKEKQVKITDVIPEITKRPAKRNKVKNVSDS